MIYYWSIQIFLLVIYFIVIVVLSISWRRLKATSDNKPTIKSDVYISVVIALRNEEKNIKQLIDALNQQDLSHALFEVILVNDHSTDKTNNFLQKYSSEYPGLKAYQLPGNKFGKKEALKLGISKATGELLAFTDGDCLPPTKWLSTLSSFYCEHNKPDLIIGLVDLIADTWLKNIFRLDFLSLVLSGAGAANLGHPIFCNGANLSVKASAMKEYSHNTNVTSGDDVFLLHHIKSVGGKIRILKSPDHLVYSESPATFKGFLEQRTRWASKARYYKDSDTRLIALLVFAINTTLIISIILSLFHSSYLEISIAFAIKIIADASLFLQSKDIFKYKGSLWLTPIVSLVYPFYITTTALAITKRPFAWKGRKYFK